MPNYITNHLTVKGNKEIIDEMISKISTKSIKELATNHMGHTQYMDADELSYDLSFGSYDEEKNVFYYNITGCEQKGIPLNMKLMYNETEEYYIDFNKIISTPTSEKENWFEWRLKNWGTKRNSISSYLNRLEDETVFIEFETAWSTPKPIIKELSRLYPTLSFHVDFADEDISYNCGFYTYEDSYLTEEDDILDGSAEAYELSFKMEMVDRDDYTIDGDSYKFIGKNK